MISTSSFSDTIECPRPKTAWVSHTRTSNPETQYDAELVRRFNDGDEEAFVEIVSRYRGKMFAIALRHLRDYADAEEITQDVFMRAYRGLGRFRGDASLSSWLHCIAFNLSKNRYWYHFRRHRHNTCSLDSSLNADSTASISDLIASSIPDPAREAANTEFSEQVALCMERLNPNQREILTMRNQLNHSYDEIAATLELSLGTVKSRIARARESLRMHLVEAYACYKPDEFPNTKWFESSRSSGLVTCACD